MQLSSGEVLLSPVYHSSSSVSSFHNQGEDYHAVGMLPECFFPSSANHEGGIPLPPHCSYLKSLIFVVAMPKSAVRQAMLAQRRKLSVSSVQDLSRAAQELLLSLPIYQQARSLALYAATHNEVDTNLLCVQALATGKNVLYPAVVGHTLEFRQHGINGELVRGGFGIGEPPAGSPVWLPDELDLIVVPGVAFDRHGRRIGYGKGYYDRVLHTLEGSGRLWGLCYDFQLIDEILHQPHDALMDGIVTEHRVIYPCD